MTHAQPTQQTDKIVRDVKWLTYAKKVFAKISLVREV